jgi:Flp pilus assembly protein TadD
MWRFFSIAVVSYALLLPAGSGTAIAQGEDDDILQFLPAIIAARTQAGDPSIRNLATQYAAWAMSQAVPLDKSAILSRAVTYPEGGKPPYFTLVDGKPSLVIPSRAAAYYILGAMAVTQHNRTVALWAFAEAARRNPASLMYLNNFAFALLEFDKFEDARKVLEYITQQEPDFLSATVNLGVAYGALALYGQAAEAFRKAINMFPQMPDYYNLGAQAYQLNGQDAAAWSLASLGQQYYPGDLDFQSIIDALDYPSSPLNCSLPNSCLFNNACLDFYTYGESEALAEVADWEGGYIANTLNPAYLAADQNLLQCEQNASIRGQICVNSSPPELQQKCWCEALIAAQYCGLAREQRIYSEEAIFYGLLTGRNLLAEGKVKTKLDGIQSQLSSTEYNFLECSIRDNFALYLDGIAEDEEGTLSAQMQYILIAMSNVSNAVNTCNAHFSSFDLWLYTSGASTSTGVKECFGPVCIGIDSTGKVTLDFAFGPAVALSYNPFKDDWGFALGVGLQIGAGNLSAGGMVLLKFSEDKKGVAVKGGGFTDVEYFMGYQRLPAKVTYN